MHISKLILAHLNQSVQRQLQTFTVHFWMLMIFFGGLAGLTLCLYLLLVSTFYTPLVIVYFAWILYDWNCCKRGGRRIEWVRRWSVWRYFSDYFPIRLIKTAELDAHNTNYVIGYHPHGVITCGAYCNFATEATNFSQLFPGVVPHLVTLSAYFRLPFLRELFCNTGLCCSSQESIRHILTKKGKGNAVVIVVGGVAEGLISKPDRLALNLNSRKGFIKMAISCGADLIPVISFGETDNVRLSDVDCKMKHASRMSTIMSTLIGLCPALFYYFCFWPSRTRSLMPSRKPITTVVGKAIPVVQESSPSDDTVEHYHNIYKANLRKLFSEYQHKLRHTYPQTTLHIQ